jgi:tRNA modification GTPase
MSQLQGSLSQFMAKIEANLLELLSFAEASFEFLDEEQRDLDFDEKLRQKIALLLINLQEIKVNFNQQQQIRQGIRIALIGAVNAGKSTLFNSLVRKDRAIVTPVAGTTRDSIEFSLYRDGAFWLVIDTAGLRQTGDFIEQQGIERSLQEANTADVVLLVIDASAKLTPEQIDLYKELSQKYVGKLIFVANKIGAGDIGGVASLFDQHFCAVSAKTKQGLDELEFAIAEKIQKLFNQLNSPYILNQRQYQLISEIEHKLESIECNNQDGIQYELIAYHLKEALERLSDLTGRNVTEKVLDKVFDEFCVGK